MAMVMIVIIGAVMVTDMVLVMVMAMVIVIVKVLDMLMVMVLGMVITVVKVMDIMWSWWRSWSGLWSRFLVVSILVVTIVVEISVVAMVVVPKPWKCLTQALLSVLPWLPGSLAVWHSGAGSGGGGARVVARLSSPPLGSGQPIFLGMQRRCCTHHNRSMPLKSVFSAEKMSPLCSSWLSDCLIGPVHPFDVKRLFPLSLILKLELILAFLSYTYCGVDRNPHVSRKSICLTDKTIDCHVCCIITSQLLPCLIVLWNHFVRYEIQISCIKRILSRRVEVVVQQVWSSIENLGRAIRSHSLSLKIHSLSQRRAPRSLLD